VIVAARGDILHPAGSLLAFMYTSYGPIARKIHVAALGLDKTSRGVYRPNAALAADRSSGDTAWPSLSAARGEGMGGGTLAEEATSQVPNSG